MEEKKVLAFEEWVQTVPRTITQDPLWTVEAYRLALYAAATSWPHVKLLNDHSGTRSLGNQLYRSAGSIPANISEGYSRSSPLERARFYEYALGSSRESRDWYFLGRHVLDHGLAEHPVELLTQVIKLLTTMIRQQRPRQIREEEIEYNPDGRAARAVSTDEEPSQ